MMRLNKRWMITSLTLVIILLTTLTAPVWGQGGTTRFSRVLISQLLTVVGTTTLTGDVELGDDLLITGGVDGFITNNLAAAITVTNNSTVTPLGTVQRVTAASAVGTSGANIVVQPAGTILVLLNTGSNTITFTETGTLVSSGNIALGANDSATLVSNGTNYYQIAASNN